jgi:hypothetical protein
VRAIGTIERVSTLRLASSRAIARATATWSSELSSPPRNKERWDVLSVRVTTEARIDNEVAKMPASVAEPVPQSN